MGDNQYLCNFCKLALGSSHACAVAIKGQWWEIVCVYIGRQGQVECKVSSPASQHIPCMANDCVMLEHNLINIQGEKGSVLTQTCSLNRARWGIVPSEEGSVHIQAMEDPWHTQLNDAPVMTLQT